MKIVCEANHRLGYFIRELNTLPDAKFILLIRNPCQTLISRIATLAHWSEIIERYPPFFQEAITKLVALGKEDFNTYRVRPQDMNKPLWRLYVDEWIINYRETRSQLAEVNNSLVVETESIGKELNTLLGFVGAEKFDIKKAASHAAIRLDSVYDDPLKKDLIDLAKEMIMPNESEINQIILDEFSNDEDVKKIIHG